jgi:hypothetical protein
MWRWLMRLLWRRVRGLHRDKVSRRRQGRGRRRVERGSDEGDDMNCIKHVKNEQGELDNDFLFIDGCASVEWHLLGSKIMA